MSCTLWDVQTGNTWYSRKRVHQGALFLLLLSHSQVYAEGLVHLDSARTLQGSPLSFSCGGMDNIVSTEAGEAESWRHSLMRCFLFEQGDIFVNDGKCRIIQRHLIFDGGIAYGIDCLLTPPSLGGRCDKQTTFQLSVCPCSSCQTVDTSMCRKL